MGDRRYTIVSKGICRVFLGGLFLFFLSSISYTLSARASEPFFVTIQKVELKDEAGRWMTVIEPDKKVDLAQSEPSVSFFNNGRVVPGRYVNVRVQLDRGVLVRSEDYEVPLSIKKGTFVNITFGFDFAKPARGLSRDNFKQIHVTVDEDERTDGGDKITIGG